MRYTEARLEKLTQEVFLADLDKNVVDFMPNFDETEKEPVVLPVRSAQSSGQRSRRHCGWYGYQHSASQSGRSGGCGESLHQERRHHRRKSLMQYICRDRISRPEDLWSIKMTCWRSMRPEPARSVFAEKWKWRQIKGRQRQQLVITEIPYTMIGANIGKFLNDVAYLVESKKTTDIVDISNQSSKEGIRIVLELKRDADVENLTNMLYKKTRLEDTFGVNMLAVADGRPETLSLKQIIEHHVDFQFEVNHKKIQDPSWERTGEERDSGRSDQGLRCDRPDHRDPAWKQEPGAGKEMPGGGHHRGNQIQVQEQARRLRRI